MKIGLLGSEGFLGSGLYDTLKVDHDALGITRANYNDHRGEEFDVLVNANGNSKRYWANTNVLEDFDASTASVYKTLFDFKIKVYIYISSADVYEGHDDPLKTDENNNVNPLNLCSYGFHKYLSELLVKKYSNKYLILRCSALIGDNMKKGSLKDLLEDKPLFVTSDSELQYITTDEVTNIIAVLLKNKIHNEVFNIGGAGAVSFDYLGKLLNKNPVIHKEAEKQVYQMNVSKLSKLFPLKKSEDYVTEYLKPMMAHK